MYYKYIFNLVDFFLNRLLKTDLWTKPFCMAARKSTKIVTLYQESSDLNPASETINVVIKIMDCEKAIRKNYAERIINLETAVFFLCCEKSV